MPLTILEPEELETWSLGHWSSTTVEIIMGLRHYSLDYTLGELTARQTTPSSGKGLWLSPFVWDAKIHGSLSLFLDSIRSAYIDMAVCYGLDRRQVYTALVIRGLPGHLITWHGCNQISCRDVRSICRLKVAL